VKVIYMAHPVSGDVEGNLAKARIWYKWICDNYPEVAVVASWIVDCEVYDNGSSEQYDISLKRDQAIVSRCDEIWLCGARVSNGMNLEAYAAIAAGKIVRDLTGYELPPPGKTQLPDG